MELYVGDTSFLCYGLSNLVWLRLEIKQNHRSNLKKVIFGTNLQQMFKRTNTDLNIQLTTTQHRVTCTLKNARLLPDGCWYLNNTVSKILFRINISPPLTTIAGFDGMSQWLGLPGHRTSHQWTSSYGVTLKPWFTSPQLILFQWFCLISNLSQTQFDGPLQGRISDIYFLDNKSLFCSALSPN
jgi:hypothetical protein